MSSFLTIICFKDLPQNALGSASLESFQYRITDSLHFIFNHTSDYIIIITHHHTSIKFITVFVKKVDHSIFCLVKPHTHIHKQLFYGPFSGLPGEPVPEETFGKKIFLWTLRCNRRYQRQTHQQSSGVLSDPSLSSPHFYAGCPSCCNHPNLSRLVAGTKYAGLHTQ